MSPMIVAALTAESVETVQSHVEIFKDIKRVHNIVKRYQECQKMKLLQQWKGITAWSKRNDSLSHFPFCSVKEE